MIYLASPYTHRFFWVRWWRWIQVARVTAMLMQQGLHVFSPIANTHWIAVFFKLPGDFEYWKKYNEDMIKRCGRFVVLKLEGWETSKGCIGEAVIAAREGKGVSYMDPKTLREEVQVVSRDTSLVFAKTEVPTPDWRTRQ